MRKSYSFVFLVVFLLFTGCSSSKVEPHKIKMKNFTQNEIFYEDSLILYALRAEEIGDYRSASSLFYKLYKVKPQRDYLYHSLQNDIYAKNYLLVLEKIDKEEKKEDIALKRFKLIALIKEKKLLKAKKLAENILNKTKEVDDYIRLSDIYILLNQPKKALNFLEKAYLINYDNRVIDRISTLLYNHLNKKDEAIKRLEIHREIHGSTSLILLRLAMFYSDKKDLDNLLATYLALYKLDKKNDIAKKIIQIYEYKKDYLSLEDFLQTYHVDDVRLLQLYVATKNYKDAYKLAYMLYQQDGTIDYLGESALYEYEYYKITKDKKLLDKIIEKLEDLLSKNDVALYNNYLGYLLIDHEIDIKRGLSYVKKALVQEPNSIYILDSLAWGYFKLGRCEKADLIMQKVLSQGSSDNEEIRSHKDSIDRCKNKRRRKR